MHQLFMNAIVQSPSAPLPPPLPVIVNEVGWVPLTDDGMLLSLMSAGVARKLIQIFFFQKYYATEMQLNVRCE